MESTTISVSNNFTSTIVPVLQNYGKNITFSWYDYILFSFMLVLSSIIGIYFGCFGNKQSTANEYLMGNKEMKVIPIAISLVASHISGISLLALPADVYKNGASYWLGTISLALLAVATTYIYLPVFYQLGITSTYEYLELRFDEKTRKCASILFAFSLFVYLPIVTYIPALAFSAATGISVHLITPVVCGVCIFYTTIGGLKAVVWTDTLQFTITVGALFTVFGLGLNTAGGISTVWKKALVGQRLDVFNFDPNPTVRESFWAIVIGLTVHWIGHTSVNQGCVQKFLSVASLRDAKKSVVYYCFGMSLIKTVCVLIGLIMYTLYANCDPFSTKQIKKGDELLPYYVMDVSRSIPGLSGLFIAGIFCAALSTLSANLNCLAGTIYEDFLSSWLEKRESHKTAGYILKLIVIVTGVISTLMVYIIEHLGALLNLSISLGSVAHGPILGMFNLGLLFPRANKNKVRQYSGEFQGGKNVQKWLTYGYQVSTVTLLFDLFIGAFYGSIIGVLCMTVCIFGEKYYESVKLIINPGKPVSTEGCTFIVNSTISVINQTLHETSKYNPLFFFRFSFYYLTLIGSVITMVSGLIVSYLTNKNEKPARRDLLSPAIHFLLPKENPETYETDNIEYYSVKKALQVIKNESNNE